MFDSILLWLEHWLPLIQGFAALASIGGAVLSWRYALKAQRAREEMIQNIVTSKLISNFELTVRKLHETRAAAVRSDGKPDYSAYQLREQESKKILEFAHAEAKASGSYFRKLPPIWVDLLQSLSSAASKPDAYEIEKASKSLTMVLAELRHQASTRELAPS
jgi:hypothetical protein